MIRIYLDENVSARLVEALAAMGMDAISANEHHKGVDDATQLLIARELGRVLVTHNTSDFALLHRAWTVWSAAWGIPVPPTHGGILLMHSATGYDPSQIAAEIKALVDRLGSEESPENRVFAWSAANGWSERLIVGRAQR